MRNSYLIFVLAVCFVQHNLAQENSIVYDKVTGMEISANDGDYLFKIGGFIQPAVKSVSDGVLSFEDTKSEQIYKSKASVFMLSGTMKNEKLRFMIILSARYPHFFCLTAGFIRFGGQSLVICRDLCVFEG